MGILVSIITLINSQLIILSVHGEMLWTLEVLRFSVGCIIMPVFYTLITVSASFMTRSTIFGIVIPLIILFLPVITVLLPFTLQNLVIPILPSSAIHSIIGKVSIGNIEYTGLFFSLIILMIWCLLFINLTAWRFNRKDL